MFDFLRKKPTTLDRLEDIVVELDPEKSYFIVVPDDVDLEDIQRTKFFEGLHVFVMQAKNVKVVEMGG